VLVARNAIIDNNTDNFAPEGNIVASVPAGTGVMVMANTGVQVIDNALINNSTSHVMLIAYTQEFDDARYQPRPVDVFIHGNLYGSVGTAPDFDGGGALAEAFGGALPAILTDGLHQGLVVQDSEPVLSLGLTKVGQPLTEVQPQILSTEALAENSETVGIPPVELPEGMEARLN